MRITIVSLCMLLLPALVWAGTWRDDFEDGDLDGWLETFSEKLAAGVWKIQDGVLIGERASGWGVSLTIGDGATWRDYVIECDVRVTKRIPNEWGGKYHYAGVTGRLQHENRLENAGAGFVLNFTAVPTMWEYAARKQDNRWVFAQDVQKPFNAKLNTWYHLTSSMKGNLFKVYVDGQFISSFDSKLIPTGRVGITMGGCVAEFDNIVIRGPDVPDTGFAINPEGKLTAIWGMVKQRR